MTTELIDTPTAAKRLGLRPATLNTWRTRGIGPAWVKVGGRLVRYRADVIDAYIASSIRGVPALLGAAA